MALSLARFFLSRNSCNQNEKVKFCNISSISESLVVYSHDIIPQDNKKPIIFLRYETHGKDS